MKQPLRTRAWYLYMQGISAFKARKEYRLCKYYPKITCRHANEQRKTVCKRDLLKLTGYISQQTRHWFFLLYFMCAFSFYPSWLACHIHCYWYFLLPFFCLCSALPTKEWLLPSVSLCFCHQGTMSLAKPRIKRHKDLVSHGALMIRGRWSGIQPISMIPLPGLAIKTQKGHVCPKDTLLYIILCLCWR